jgi:uncharacterized protein (DUF427 family)
MRIPGPDHPISIVANPMRLRARFGDHVIADTSQALTLDEAGCPPRHYFPREDISMSYFGRTDKVTHCPYKGDASYYTLVMDGRILENVAWSYETPYPAMELIAGKLAFYTDKIEVYEFGPADRPDEVREAIEHTDDGEGVSQREHWPASTEDPPDAARSGGVV